MWVDKNLVHKMWVNKNLVKKMWVDENLIQKMGLCSTMDSVPASHANLTLLILWEK